MQQQSEQNQQTRAPVEKH